MVKTGLLLALGVIGATSVPLAMGIMAEGFPKRSDSHALRRSKVNALYGGVAMIGLGVVIVSLVKAIHPDEF